MTTQSAGTEAVQALTTKLEDPTVRKDVALVGLEAGGLIAAANRLLSCDDSASLVEALDQNLQLWVAIRSTVANPEMEMPDAVRHNLRALANIVADMTLASGQRRLEVREIERLAQINLDITRGLAEGDRQRLIRERAYELWEHAGRPAGKADDFWYAAEREIDAAIGPA